MYRPSLLSSTVFQEEPYVIQELQPIKDTLKFKMIKDDYRDLYQVVYDMATLTASYQLRSGGIDGSAIIDQLKTFGDDPTWHQPVIDLALHYSNVVRAEFRQFLKDFKRQVLW